MTAPILASYFNDKDGDGRYYRNPFTGHTAPSVTTINSMVNKNGLKQWYVDMALKEIIKNPDGFFQRDPKDFFKGYRFAAEKFRDDRAAIGSDVHSVIEAELTNAWEVPEVWDQEVAQCIVQWHNFLNEHDVRPLYVETTVWNEELPLAGTADFIGWIDGKFGVYDVKTSRKIHHENELQLAMLAHCPEILLQVPEGTEGAVFFEKEVTKAGVKSKVSAWFIRRYWMREEIEAAGFIHLRPDEYDPMTGKFVPAFQALVPVEIQDWDLQWREAVGYAGAYEASKALEKRRKEREKE